MSVRQKMTMRAIVQRNQSTTDPDGQPGPPDWQTITAEQACYIWEDKNIVIIDGMTTSINVLMMLVPKSADIEQGDRLSTVVDRRGTTLYSLLYIENDGMLRKTHKAMRLKKIA